MSNREPGRSRKSSERRFPPGGINGLRLVWTNVTTVTVQVGECRDSTDSYDMELVATQAVVITADGAGGLDTGTESSGAATWYHVYLIQGGLGTSATLSVHATTPTLPAGYQYYRRIGSVMRFTDNDFQRFYQFGPERERTYHWDEVPASFTTVMDNGDQDVTYLTVSLANHVGPYAHSFICRCQTTVGGDNESRLKITNPVDATEAAGVWTNLSANKSRYRMTVIPVHKEKSFDYATSSSSKLTVICHGWMEYL